MRIQHNIMAMSAYRNYTNNVSAMKKNLEKLSSGYKINRAGDDAAGLAISEKMRAQITGLETAQKNAKDGISLVQTAEGALTEVHDMLNRMVELASMSANGTYDNTTDRKQLQKEMDQLTAEINRIADSSNFNGINLLDGSMSQGGQGTTAAGIDRIIKEVLGAGEDPVALAGIKTILDGGNNSSVNTVFDVDFTGLSGAQAVEGVPSGSVAAEIESEKDGKEPTVATADTITFTIADPTATGNETQVGDATGGNTQVTIGGATGDLSDLATATDANGVLLKDLYDIKIEKKAGGDAIESWDTTPGDYTFAEGDKVTLTAKTKGETGAAENDLKGLVTNGDVAVTLGKDEGGATAAAPASYKFTLNMANLEGGQKISLNGKDIVVTNAAGDASGAGKLAINGYDLTDKNADTTTHTKGLAQLAKDLETAFGATDEFNAYDVTVEYDAATGKADFTLTAKTADETGNKGELSVMTNSGTNPLDGTVTYNKYTPAGAAAAGEFAEVTYANDSLKATALKAGSTLTIGSGDTAVKIEVMDDTEYTAAVAAGTVKANQIKESDVGTKLAQVIENQAGFRSGMVNYDSTNGKLTFKAAEAGTGKLADLKTATKVSVATPPDPAAADADKVKFSFKLGGKEYKDISVAKDASSEDIAKAVSEKLTAETEVNGAKWDVKLNGSKVTFTLKDAPNANNIKGNFDWDVEATAGTFKGNHTAGTVVTTPGNVGAAGSLANTVFNITTDDIKDGTKITIDGKSVTLAVGADSKYKDAEGAINLTALDPKNISAADLNVALGRISEGFGKDGTTNFIVGVNDKANGDTNIGLTVHKKTSSTKEYTTLQELGDVFKLETAGTGRALTLQIGDTADPFNQLKVDIQDMHAVSLGIGKDQISIADQDSAADAITKIKDAINMVSDVRGTLGATQNRLDHTINNLSVMTENIQDAESTIRDVDVAEEMMAYTKNNILIQSAQAMLAQANQVPQGVLQLLG